LLYTMPPSTTHYTLSSQHLTSSILFSFNNTAITEIYTLSLHDALPISKVKIVRWPHADFCCWNSGRIKRGENGAELVPKGKAKRDRKSTRLNSSHVAISYAVFCLKKKINKYIRFHVINQDIDAINKLYY